MSTLCEKPNYLAQMGNWLYVCCRRLLDVVRRLLDDDLLDDDDRSRCRNPRGFMCCNQMEDDNYYHCHHYGINKDGYCDCPGYPCTGCGGCDPPELNREGVRFCKIVAAGGCRWQWELFLSTEGAEELTPEGSTRGQSQVGRVFCSNCLTFWNNRNGSKYCPPAQPLAPCSTAQSGGGQDSQAKQTMKNVQGTEAAIAKRGSSKRCNTGSTSQSASEVQGMHKAFCRPVLGSG